jgi:chromosome segregation ATPase
LSTLTKILIVLLSVSTIFLCGIVVTYVASSTNYKQQYEELKTRIRAAEDGSKSAKEQLNKTKDEAEKQKQDLGKQIADANDKIESLTSELKSAILARDAANRTVQDWANINKQFTETNKQQASILDSTLAENTKIKDELSKTQTELKNVDTILLQKNALIASLEIKNKQLIEEKTSLQDIVDKSLQANGKTLVTPAPVTQSTDIANPAPEVKSIDLKGKISALDPRNSTAKIDLGASSGVKQKMIFYIWRGEDFIAQINIFEVDQSSAIGTLELVQKPPKVGDIVSTNSI